MKNGSYWPLCGRTAKTKPAAAGSVEFEPMLDAIHAPVDIVHAFVQDGIVGVDIGNVAAQAGDAVFQRTHAHGERVQRALHVAGIGANRFQVFDDEVYKVFGHGAAFAGTVTDKSAFDSRARGPGD